MRIAKKILLVATATLLAVGLFGCGGTKSGGSGETTLVVGATPVPHAEILEQVKPMLKEKGINLEIKEFTDYNTPNISLAEGSINANYFQHWPYLDDWNKKNGKTLTYTVAVHFEPLGLYSQKIKSLSELKPGAHIAVPNDTTNEARALLLLQDNGLLKLKEGAGIAATRNDIVENPKNLVIEELEAAQLTRALPDVDAAVINGNYALDAGLSPKQAIVSESAQSLAAKTYANILAVRPEDKDNAAIKALSEALTSPEIKKFIEEKYQGAVVPVF
ncbi:MAG: MetQ/NlpA family ABC transporter substrate-binding protein [Clostridia bacterium]|nr:MetQ/NlpA family ABC transporter substrate-binding protein [Clostridia bacterium]